jgi:hypothetical protein
MNNTTDIKAERRELERHNRRAKWLRAAYKRFQKSRPDIAPFYKIMAEQAEAEVKYLEESLVRSIELQDKLDAVLARIAKLEARK